MKEKRSLLMSLDLISAISQYLYNNRKKHNAESGDITNVTEDNNEYFDELDAVAENEDIASYATTVLDDTTEEVDDEVGQNEILESLENAEDKAVDDEDTSLDSNEENLLDALENSIDELNLEAAEQMNEEDASDDKEQEVEKTEEMISESSEELGIPTLETPILETPVLEQPVLETPELNLSMNEIKKEDDSVVCPSCNHETHETTEKRCELCGALLDVNEGASESETKETEILDDNTENNSDSDEVDPFSNYEDPNKSEEQSEPEVMKNTEPLHNVDSSEKAKKEYDSIMEFFNSL